MKINTLRLHFSEVNTNYTPSNISKQFQSSDVLKIFRHGHQTLIWIECFKFRIMLVIFLIKLTQLCCHCDT